MRIRLQKILADAGIASRRKAEALIVAGKVVINGCVQKTLGAQADPEKDKILVQGRPLVFAKKKYIKLYKPRGYVSSTVSQEGKSVLELVNANERLFLVGRLDKESEGLLILTNDGNYALQATHPRFEHEKEYVVELDKPLTAAHMHTLEHGTMRLDGVRLLPMRVSGKNQNRQIINLILKEGRKHQIRRVLDRLGYTVKRLVRVRMGSVELGQMKPGEWRTFEPQVL